MRVAAISDVTGTKVLERGFTADEINEAPTVRALAAGDATEDPIIEMDVDVLIPAALGGVIVENNAERVKASLVVEAANQPISTTAADSLLARGITVVPDILANAGGVLGSYFEWTQNIQEFRWPIERFRIELDQRMEQAFTDVAATADERAISLREASFVVALERVAESFRLRGRVL
jgi:glutamate dehydrogenase (NAD(P)+)